jgi:hypothetical protein
LNDLEYCLKVDVNAAFYVPSIMSVYVRQANTNNNPTLEQEQTIWFGKLMNMLHLYKNHQTMNNVMSAILNVVDLKPHMLTPAYKQLLTTYKQYTDPNIRTSIEHIFQVIQQEKKVKLSTEKKIRLKVQHKAEKRVMAIDAHLAYLQVQEKMVQAFAIPLSLAMAAQLTYVDLDNDTVCGLIYIYLLIIIRFV